jgi:hypothetical protein
VAISALQARHAKEWPHVRWGKRRRRRSRRARHARCSEEIHAGLKGKGRKGGGRRRRSGECDEQIKLRGKDQAVHQPAPDCAQAGWGRRPSRAERGRRSWIDQPMATRVSASNSVFLSVTFTQQLVQRSAAVRELQPLSKRKVLTTRSGGEGQPLFRNVVAPSFAARCSLPALSPLRSPMPPPFICSASHAY